MQCFGQNSWISRLLSFVRSRPDVLIWTFKNQSKTPKTNGLTQKDNTRGKLDSDVYVFQHVLLQRVRT